MQARYRGKTTCPSCKGARLKPEALYVKVGGKNIAELVSLPITEAKAFFDNLVLDETDAAVAKRLLTEIMNRLQFLLDVGLGYLTLGEETPSLSGGEAQRLKLAGEMGKGQSDTVFIFDEPTIGLHPLDVRTLLKVFQTLIESGATVIVIEHDLDVIRSADYIIDMGPGGGEAGGIIVAAGTPEQVAANKNSITGKYLCK